MNSFFHTAKITDNLFFKRLLFQFLFTFVLMKKLALFASGNGSNVKAILQYFAKNSSFKFPLICTNNLKAGVLGLAKENNIPCLVFDKPTFTSANFIAELKNFKLDGIILAGFLWKIPETLILAFPDKILNIHPALLPKYGGKGMYGHFVHEAVKLNNEIESGITIHLVNKNYDEGKILLQKSIPIKSSDTVERIAEKVLYLEHEHYSKVIENYFK